MHKFPATRNFSVQDYDSFMLDCFNNRSTVATNVNNLLEKEGVLTRDKYEVEEFVSTDQFIFNTPGQLPTGCGRDSSDRRFQGGKKYND